jgi:hypothetical protein
MTELVQAGLELLVDKVPILVRQCRPLDDPPGRCVRLRRLSGRSHEKIERDSGRKQESDCSRKLGQRQPPALDVRLVLLVEQLATLMGARRGIEVPNPVETIGGIVAVAHLRVGGRFTRHLPILSAAMGADNPLEALGTLPEEVLAEVVREGELKLQAQLDVSLASDLRALSLAGFSLTGSTALLGAAAALARDARPDYPVMIIAAGLGVALLASGGLAVLSARPVQFHFPGNEPKNWLPSEWDLANNEKPTLKRARVEQAIVLQSLIGKNQKACERNARLTTAALTLIFGAAAIAAFSFAGVLVLRGIAA